jgi:hypothetical protein
MNPLKAFVYCSIGVPVVSTPIANLGDLADLITIARGPTDSAPRSRRPFDGAEAHRSRSTCTTCLGAANRAGVRIDRSISRSSTRGLKSCRHLDSSRARSSARRWVAATGRRPLRRDHSVQPENARRRRSPTHWAKAAHSRAVCVQQNVQSAIVDRSRRLCRPYRMTSGRLAPSRECIPCDGTRTRWRQRARVDGVDHPMSMHCNCPSAHNARE